jgi:hypothetical protein
MEVSSASAISITIVAPQYAVGSLEPKDTTSVGKLEHTSSGGSVKERIASGPRTFWRLLARTRRERERAV